MARGASLEGYGKSRLFRGSNLRPSSPWRVAIATTLPPAANILVKGTPASMQI